MAAVNGRPSSPFSPSDYTDFAHTGRDTLAGRYLRHFWQPVYLGRKLATGYAIPLRVLCEDFTLFRGESGHVHLLDSCCAHRGTQLSTGWVEGDCVRCFYHGWKYDASGQCVEMPAEDPSFPPKVRIGGYPVEEYLGMIFAYLGEGAPPPLPRWPEFEGDRALEASCVPRGCNYFQNVENTVDDVHVPFVHRGGLPLGDMDFCRDLPTLVARETAYGIELVGAYADGRRSLTRLLMPNCFIDSGVPLAAAKQSLWGVIRSGAESAAAPAPDVAAGEPFQANVVWRVPIDDERHNQFALRFLDVSGDAIRVYNTAWQEREQMREELPTIEELGEGVLAGRLSLAELHRTVNPFKMIQVQDWAGMVGQGRIADRTNERLGHSDVGIILLRQIWERELRAFAERRPLTLWAWPPVRPV